MAIPAITTQWSDRQKELALKDSLITRFTESAAAAIEDAGFLVRDEAIHSGRRVPTAVAESWRSRHTSIARDWNVTASALDSELAAYFPNSHLAGDSTQQLGSAFRRYKAMVESFIFLSSEVCKGDRAAPTEALRKYVAPGSWQQAYPHLSDQSVAVGCWRKTPQFKDAYLALGATLLDRRQPLLTTLVGANAAGYSVGFGDFVRQLLPFV